MSTTESAHGATAAAIGTKRVPVTSGTWVITGATVVLALLALLFVDNFASGRNLRGLFLSVSLIGIIAVGLSLVTLVGRVFTLSIPALVAMSSLVFASTLGLGPGLALLITVVMAAVVGAVQGVIVGCFDADPIITTIAAAAVLGGIGQLWVHGRTVIGDGDATLFNSDVLGIVPFQTLVFVLIAVGAAWWHGYTVTGRTLTLVGLNSRAATVSGLRAWPMVVLAFTVSGAATGLAGSLLAAQTGQGTLLLGAGFGFDAIVAVVVGGVSVRGGVGSPVGAAIGAMFVGLVENVLALLGLSYQVQLVTQGVLVLVAVTVMGVATTRRT